MSGVSGESRAMTTGEVAEAAFIFGGSLSSSSATGNVTEWCRRRRGSHLAGRDGGVPDLVILPGIAEDSASNLRSVNTSLSTSNRLSTQ